MTQRPPKYRHMASCANPVIQGHLRSKYGRDRVCWPIVWLRDRDIQFYTFELTSYCDTNVLNGRRPVSRSSKGCHFVSYIETPRVIVPPEPLLIPSIDVQYECSYDYVTGSPYVTVDLDYVWEKDGEWCALELTTWYRQFCDREEAERLVRYMRRRDSWQSSHGASGISKQIEAVGDLSVSRYIMACVNTREKADTELVTEGNAYWFDLSTGQVGRLSRGRLPEDASFGAFEDLLEVL